MRPWCTALALALVASALAGCSGAPAPREGTTGSPTPVSDTATRTIVAIPPEGPTRPAAPGTALTISGCYGAEFDYTWETGGPTRQLDGWGPGSGADWLGLQALSCESVGVANESAPARLVFETHQPRTLPPNCVPENAYIVDLLNAIYVDGDDAAALLERHHFPVVRANITLEDTATPPSTRATLLVNGSASWFTVADPTPHATYDGPYSMVWQRDGHIYSASASRHLGTTEVEFAAGVAHLAAPTLYSEAALQPDPAVFYGTLLWDYQLDGEVHAYSDVLCQNEAPSP